MSQAGHLAEETTTVACQKPSGVHRPAACLLRCRHLVPHQSSRARRPNEPSWTRQLLGRLQQEQCRSSAHGTPHLSATRATAQGAAAAADCGPSCVAVTAEGSDKQGIPRVVCHSALYTMHGY